jgi:hypothetical protein
MKLDILETIRTRHIRLSPVMGPKGVDYWTAGIAVYHRGTQTCGTPNHLHARGSTIEEAVTKLCEGRTLYRLDADGCLVEQPEHS